ncbi:hypothetical protein IVA95_27970 [Bradyrhizobium sp. 157]|uniref:hypothetical protein n=1 Tax=Bradyrhizobium sp. 157 TaxID=2782631 RepID=UPI001FFA9BAF|nr:hypothetical protein [Bradyrhizobium sp. 157]MCK1641312.1 hypothetical protein [Bradyrhizobium sp. 157]
MAVNGVDTLLAPFTVSLYGIFASGPFFLECVVLAGLLAYAYLSLTLRNVGSHVTDRKEVDFEAALQRSDSCAGS